MKISFIVAGVSITPSGNICITLKNKNIQDESGMQKVVKFDMFNPAQVMEGTMQAAMAQQQKMLGIEPNYSKLIITKEQFEKCRVTAEDEIELDIKVGEQQ